MPEFHVIKTFEIPDRHLFVMAGSILAGEIRTGMFVRIPFNSSFALTLRIHCIEFARHSGGEDICLCIQAERETAEILRDLDLGNQTLAITAEGSE
jgi:hypothetical protein